MALRVILIILFSNLLAHAKDLRIVTYEEFYNQNPSKERKIILDFLTQQFEDKKIKGVTQAQLDQVWNNIDARNTLHMARFQIINQQLYADSEGIYRPYFLNLLEYFKNFIKIYKVEDVDFIIYARDEIPPNNLAEEVFNVPAFMMFKNLNSIHETNTLIMPDSTFLKPSWRELIKKIEEANSIYNWDSKIEQLFWRGSTTGGKATYQYNIQNFDKFDRLKLVMLSKLYPEEINAFFINPNFSTDESGRNLKKMFEILFGKENSYTKEAEHLKYKYLVSLDGNSATGTRVPWIMLSNSVLIKQNSRKIEWFYNAIKPYVHYIPIKSDLTDIFEQYRWLKTHDNNLKQITFNGQTFVKNELMPEHIDAHMAIILKEYAKLQKDAKIIATLTPADDVISIKSVALVIAKKIKRFFIDILSF